MIASSDQESVGTDGKTLDFSWKELSVFSVDGGPVAILGRVSLFALDEVSGVSLVRDLVVSAGTDGSLGGSERELSDPETARNSVGGFGLPTPFVGLGVDLEAVLTSLGFAFVEDLAV